MEFYILLRFLVIIMLYSIILCLLVNSESTQPIENVIKSPVNETMIADKLVVQNTNNKIDNTNIDLTLLNTGDSVNMDFLEEDPPPPDKEHNLANDSIDEITDFVLLDSISTNSGIKGMPDMPSAPSIVTLVKSTAKVKLEKVLQEDLVIDTNKTTTTIDPSSALHTIADIIQVNNDQITNETKNTKDENITSEEVLLIKEIEFPQKLSPDGQINRNNESGGITMDNNKTITNNELPLPSLLPPIRDDKQLLNLTMDENQIPVFSEWAQKRMEEAEKKMEQDNVNTSTHKKNSTYGNKTPILKLRVKNYASPDCGAKIIAANPEASSTGSVLSTTKDEYLLSPCTSRIWFVVELCEAIQAEIIDLANFELFSSSPKNFSISVSNRFPTREWSNVGRFTAKDERNIQTFDLHPHLFGKYVRVDIHSHYNSEHFCPISLFRVYGTSEFEAFETENRIHIDDDLDDNDDGGDEQLVDHDAQKAPKKTVDNNIFKSASDAVMSIVKKAASFVKPNENKTNGGAVDLLLSNSIVNDAMLLCVTPNFQIVCRNCSQNLMDNVNHLLSCKQHILTNMLKVHLIKNSVYKSRICANLVGFDNGSGCRQIFNNVSSIMTLTDSQKDYVSNMIPISYVAAMCNILAAAQRLTNGNSFDMPVANTLSADVNNIKQQITIHNNLNDTANIKPQLFLPDEDHKEINPNGKHQDDLLSQNVKDTKFGSIEEDYKPPTNSERQDTKERIDPIHNTADNIKDESHVIATETIKDQSNDLIIDHVLISDPKNDLQPNTEDIKDPLILDETIGINNTWENVDDVFLTETTATTNEPSDMVAAIIDDGQLSNTVTNQQIGQKVHSESVFLRLSNRIKALERNMSLSGQYLEELSRRYKKQVEELQQSFARTLNIVEEQNKKNFEREAVLLRQIHTLRKDVEQLTNRIFSWSNICFYIGGFTFVQVSMLWIIMKIWSQRRYDNDSPASNSNTRKIKNNIRAALARRKSLDESGDISPISMKKRRPSEEALNITGTYKELLILERNDGIANPNTEEYDSFGDASKKKSKQKNRIRQTDRRKKHLSRQESAPAEYEILKESIKSSSSTDPDDTTILDEDYEIYLPGSDLVYNEFMPDGPSGVETINDATKTASSATGATTTAATIADTSLNMNGKIESKTRRLSSPAFLKSPFSRSHRKKNGHESATGWEWYRLKREPQLPSQSGKYVKKSKSESPEVKTNGIVRVMDSSVKDSKDSIKTSSSFVSGSSDKKQGSFRRILKKVF